MLSGYGTYGGGKKKELGSSQGCPETGQRAIGAKRNMGDSIRKKKKHAECSRIVKQDIQMNCGISILGDLQNPAGHAWSNLLQWDWVR